MISCPGPVWGVSFSPNGDYLVAATEEGSICVYSMKATWNKPELINFLSLIWVGNFIIILINL